MKQKPQFIYGRETGHDIELRVDEITPYAEITDIPDEIQEQIFRELLDSEDGEVDRTVMVGEDNLCRVKGHWKTTVHPQNLQGKLEAIQTAAKDYITKAIEPGSHFDWPDKDTRVEWIPDSGGIREGNVHTIIHRDKGDFWVGVEDCDNCTNKIVKLSDFNTDSLIYIATTLQTEKNK